MVVKKDIISEFKQLNKELEKHLGKIGTDVLIEKQLNSIQENDLTIDSENLTLISSSLIDIRTEMALLRKHFSNDIENIVLNSVKEQQQIFLKSMNSFQANLALEMKKNFSFELKDLTSEIRELKRNHLKTQSILEEKNIELETLKENQDFLIKLIENSSLVQDFEFDKLIDDISDLKTSIELIQKDSKSQIFKEFDINLKNKFEKIEAQLDFTNSNLSKLFGSVDDIEKNFSNKINSKIENKFNIIENKINSYNSNSNSNMELLLDEIHDFEDSYVNSLKIKEKNHSNQFNKKLDSLIKSTHKSNSPNLDKNLINSTNSQKSSNPKLLSIEKNLSNLEKTIKEKPQSQISNKIFDLDNKLKQLNLVE